MILLDFNNNVAFRILYISFFLSNIVHLYHRYEAMTDLVRLLDSLVDHKGNILIDGINEDVLPVTEEEEEIYGPIDFDPVSKETNNAEYLIATFC